MIATRIVTRYVLAHRGIKLDEALISKLSLNSFVDVEDVADFCLKCAHSMVLRDMPKIKGLDLRHLYFSKVAKGWSNLPKGWTSESVEKFWESVTGDVKHKVTKCIKKMEGKIDDPGAFCASLADKVDPGWRKRLR